MSASQTNITHLGCWHGHEVLTSSGNVLLTSIEYNVQIRLFKAEQRFTLIVRVPKWKLVWPTQYYDDDLSGLIPEVQQPNPILFSCIFFLGSIHKFNTSSQQSSLGQSLSPYKSSLGYTS